MLSGLWREHQRLKVLLFSRYPDQPDKPFAEFKAVLRVSFFCHPSLSPRWCLFAVSSQKCNKSRLFSTRTQSVAPKIEHGDIIALPTEEYEEDTSLFETALLQAANTGGHLPHLYSAKVHVDLILGIFGRIVYLVSLN